MADHGDDGNNDGEDNYAVGDYCDIDYDYHCYHYWAKIPSVTDASAPRFHQCSPNYKYQQLLSFMAV